MANHRSVRPKSRPQHSASVGRADVAATSHTKNWAAIDPGADRRFDAECIVATSEGLMEYCKEMKIR